MASEINTACQHWTSEVVDGDGAYVAEPRPIAVINRTGGGFVGGLLYGLRAGRPSRRCTSRGPAVPEWLSEQR
jgi:sugar/nucleoside kinase (ribokinase family)